MRKGPFLVFLCLVCSFPCFAGRLHGVVTDEKGAPLPFASVFVKGTSIGTTANNLGKYSIDLGPGTYTISCQHVNYTRMEQSVTMTDAPAELNFSLTLQQTTMKEVVVTAGAEDPAYEIIRNAIKKKKDYADALDSFTCDAYIKTLIRTRKVPKKVFGQKIGDESRRDMGVDSAGRGIIYLSESLTKIAYKKPGKVKLEVLSGRESGSNGFGFNFPTFTNFYTNNVNVFAMQMLAPRGFVSPIADGALFYYKYKYLGSFFEDGKEINQIKVIPKRKFEPLFSGTINITEGDWRIHSLDLMLLKESQLQILDTLIINQIHVPVGNDVWKTKDQSIYFTFNLLGFDAVGNFLNVYNNYNTTPAFSKKYFNNVVMAYDTAANKKSRAYWDTVRPVPLEAEEAFNFRVKDSAFKAQNDSARSRRTIDSLRRQQGRVTAGKILWSGYTRSNFHPDHPLTYTWEPLLKNLSYNTVEGVVANAAVSIRRSFPALKEQIGFTPHVRYGFSNGHLNAWGTFTFNKRYFMRDTESAGGVSTRHTWTISGGKRVSQFNKADPITPLFNSIYTLLFQQNYMKIYENYFADLGWSKRFDNDLRIAASVLYEDRLPLDNSTDFSIFKKEGRTFTPNYPFEQINAQFTRHQAVIAGIELQFRPGQKFVQFPRGKMPVGSKYPNLAFAYYKGIEGIFGSDVNFDKWRFSVSDDENFKLLGMLKFNVSIGGFLNSKKVPIQDYQHFNGNQVFLASPYLNSFQLAPYYANSTTAPFYFVGNVEHHFNGLLTNKIPLFRRLNWNLVAGANSFYVNRDNNYAELFLGLENIFKLFRVDLIGSFLNGKNGQVGVRLGFGGLLGNNVKLR
ncbi:MAG: carboxypeptidase-like regulatory domain-containing protein [Bacteroidota bacterium]|nr:carboxypeptidase-like regulatory domain-containing protein [Bacteroidota bacterium]